MKKKAYYAYAGLLLLSFLSVLVPGRPLNLLLPLYLLGVPLLLQGRLNFFFSVRHLGLGLLVSALVLAPFVLCFTDLNIIRELTFPALVTQFFLVSFPEEVFFRGFLQEVVRNDLRGVVLVSLLFAAAHLPALLLQGDAGAPLTFFPSLVMGLLYMKTSNVLTPTIFHFLSNIVFAGFML